METRELMDKELDLWDGFAARNGGSIWQARAWGDFQAQVPSRGKRWIFGVFDGERLIAGIQVIRFRWRFGLCWLYGGRGPVVEGISVEEALALLVPKIDILAHEIGAVYLRLDPAVAELKGDFGREIAEGFQPQSTLVLDLSLSEEEILAQMKQKGRYNIRLAERSGVRAYEGSVEDLNEYGRLLAETTERDGFGGHQIGFYRKMLETLGENAKLFLAEHNGVILAAAICTYFGGVATYYYGVSGNAQRELMAPYLLQWEMIREAKRRGCKTYDFLGISPTGSQGHSWDGVTEFKKKFGGVVVDYCRPVEREYRSVWGWIMKIIGKR